ncbi:MAG: tetratricopeptide repeat protein, partial [Bradyrhizobium sp.]|nr:tetratricopeptide repeat protein [Bradyrhizobium sp.]
MGQRVRFPDKRIVEPEDVSKMARNAARVVWSQACAAARAARGCLRLRPLLGVMIFAMLPQLALAEGTQQLEPVKAEASFSSGGGFARLVIKFGGDVVTDVTSAGSIIVIHFERPVAITADRLAESVPDYVSGVRVDPDGTAIRMSLAQRLRINTMQAGERTFVDLLPDSWTGPPPPLPIEVVRELAERARAAERALRQQRAEAAAKKKPPIRVRALVQPTFVRFVFEMPDGVGASSIFNDQKLTLSFSSLLTFDLADAKIAAPPNIASINQKIEGDSTLVEINMIGDVDVHSFREDKTYNIDVAFQQADKAKQQLLPTTEAAPASSAEKSKKQAAPEQHSEEIKPPTSEAIAREMKSDVKPSESKHSESKSSESKSSESKSSEAKPALPAPTEAAKSEPAPALAPSEAPKPQGAAAAPPHAEEAVKPAAMAAPSPPKMEAPKQEAAASAPATEEPKMTETPKETAKESDAPKKMTSAAAPIAAKPESKPEATAEAKPSEQPVKVDAWRDSDGLRLTFSFPSATPAASFRRGDTVWLIFDSRRPLDLEPIRAKGGAIIGEVSRMMLDKGQAIRLRLNRPQMHSLTTEERSAGASWTLIFADKVQAPPLPLTVVRNITDPALANVAIPLNNPGLLHRFIDPDAGDTLLVVTAAPPVRGFIKRQDFVDFSLLDSAHGVAIRPNSDEVGVEIAGTKIIVGKPGGLTLSSVDAAAERAPLAVRPLFDIAEWQKNQAEAFVPRLDGRIRALAQAEPDLRPQARLDLARFYMARGMYYEARGVTEAALADPNPKKDE